ncbi:MAG: ABC transporter substrate-binding protein [Thermodesulfobacteriota bacterium]
MIPHPTIALLISTLWIWFAPASLAVAETTYPVTATDDSGRRVVISQPFQRIISLYGAHTENLFAIGCADRIVGVSPNEAFPLEATRKPVFSYHDDLEKFLAARPDLVLIRPMIERGYGRLIGGLEKAGIIVVSLQPTTPDELRQYWKLLGLLTGKAREAEALTTYFFDQVDRFRKLAAGIPNRKRVYFEAIHDRMKTFSPNSMPIFLLETVGGVNAAPDAEVVRESQIAYYGKERILAKADQIDVFLAQTGVMNAATIDTIRNEPGFSVIKAVKAGQIHLIDEMLVSRPGPRLLIGMIAIGRILYPERYDTFHLPAWEVPH